MKNILPFLFLVFSVTVFSQKKVLDHDVYDNWKNLGEKLLANNGKYIAYTVNPQEGDGELKVTNNSLNYHFTIPRGYNASFTEDSRYLICKIKPPFKETRKAKIQKKKIEELPNDSLAILQLGTDLLITKADVKSYKTPESNAAFIAYHFEIQNEKAEKSKPKKDSVDIKKNALIKISDSLIALALDSIHYNISKESLKTILQKTSQHIFKQVNDEQDAENENPLSQQKDTGSDLALFNLSDSSTRLFKNISNYYFDKYGKHLLLKVSKSKKDSNSSNMVLMVDLKKSKIDTLLKAFEDARSFTFNEQGNKISFVAQIDDIEKSSEKYFQLYHFEIADKIVKYAVNKMSTGMPINYNISEHFANQYSKNGKYLFIGIAPAASLKDTSLLDFETAKLDIWNYKDDYLQTQQLKNLDADLKKSYMAVFNTLDQSIMPLGTRQDDKLTLVNEGNASWVLAESTKDNRVESQWTGQSRTSAYCLNIINGERKIIFKNLYANASPSPMGNYAYWYDKEKKQYFLYNVNTGITTNISAKITAPLFDEENDVPDLPNAYGVMGWSEGDSSLYIYDRYDIWSVSATNPLKPINISHDGRKLSLTTRFINTDKEHRFFSSRHSYLFSIFNNNDKTSSLFLVNNIYQPEAKNKIIYPNNTITSRHTLSKNSTTLLFSTENFKNAPNLNLVNLSNSDSSNQSAITITNINPQQKDYNWGTASLFTWKTYEGRMTNGIVYKPENFDSTKKYPLICYFYEKLSDGLHTYQQPAPTPSRLNIPFFVSRGYIVLAPDIYYSKGHPGNDAYNCIVSGARALVKKGFIDSTKIGLQGQSWGGYQVAYLITKTKLFAAAWAGAPVANMTSAYGGIRWESGLNRQFQYEKQQSRIGYSLWENQKLYIENSPLFHLKNVSTPLAIMHNDADGAVPWYQGIEMFTAMRRLQKPVWMLNYNGEAHNLMERRNRKDIQIREQQFFDWLLKSEPAPKWIEEGVPALEKGKDWGL